MGKRPQTPGARRAIEYSIEEARSLGHNYVGTEHLLLGLLREQEGVAAQVLMNLGLKLEDVREEVLNLLGHNMTVQGERAHAKAASLDRALMAAGPIPSWGPASRASLARRVGGWVRKYSVTFLGGLLAPVLGSALAVFTESAGAAFSGAITAGVTYALVVAVARGSSRRR